ncbi:hypothetical protein [Altererythrobacter sp. MF3-039]|uniref:hypothetical protein n=1 Tax=Altererythrobacter sp. MF3-039 TaxID=3252901 RepID=UPI00390C51E4
MTANNESTLTGEQRLKSRRNRFFRFCAIGFFGAGLVGFFSGYAADSVADGSFPPWALVVFVALAVAGFVWFSWDYFRRVDELDVMDNLWAGMIGLYFYIVAFPVWHVFYDAGVLSQPHQWTLYLATLAVSMGTYLLRKIGLR